MQNNNNLYFSQQPPAGYTAGPSQNPLFSNQQHVHQQQQQHPHQQQPFTFPAMSTSHPLPPPIPPLPPQHHHHHQQQQHHHQQSYSSTQGLMMPPPNSSSSTPSAPTAPINPSSSSLAPVLFDNSMPITDDDASWSLEDIENLKELLDQGERAKWKYIASELTKERNKRITTQACQKKFKDMFGVAEASSPLGSSLAYVVSPDGWACLGDDYTPRTIQAPKNMAHLHSDDDDDDQDIIKDYSKSSPASSFSFNSVQSLKKQSLTDSPLTNIPQQQFSYSKPATPSTASFPKPLESTSPYHFQNHQQPLPAPTQPYIMTSYPQYPYTGVPFSNYQPQPYTTTPNTTTANTATTNNNNTNNTINNNNNITTTTTTGNTTTAANPSTSAAGYGYNNYGSYNNYNASGYYNQVPQPPSQPYQRSQQQPPPTLPPPAFATTPGKPNGEPAQSDDQVKPAIQQVLQPPESPSSASHTKLESIINS